MARSTKNECSTRIGEEIGVVRAPREVIERVMLTSITHQGKAAILLTESELNELIRLLGGYHGPDMALKRQWVEDLQSLNKQTFKKRKKKEANRENSNTR